MCRRKLTLNEALPNHCEIPDCGYTLILQKHHIRPRRDGGPTTVDNIIRLCPTHHAEADRNLITSQVLYEIAAVRNRLREMELEYERTRRSAE